MASQTRPTAAPANGVVFKNCERDCVRPSPLGRVCLGSVAIPKSITSPPFHQITPAKEGT